MTAPHHSFVPAAAGLRPGWRFDPSDSPPQSLPSHTLVLAGFPPHSQPSNNWAAIPRTHPSQPIDHSYSGNAYNNPLQPIAYQTYQSYPTMAAAAEDVLKRKESHRSQCRLSSAHVTAQAGYAGHAQIIPPPPPRQSSQASLHFIPKVPFDAQTRNGSPFVVYHVCGRCHRPRSKTYHARHPIDSADSIHLSTCHRCKSPKDNYEEIIISRTQERERSPTPRIQEIESDDECAPHSKVLKEEYLSEWVEQSAVSVPEPPHVPPIPHHSPQPRHSRTKIRTTVYIDDCETSATPTRVPPSPEAHPRPIVYRHVEAPQYVDGIHRAGRTSEPELTKPPVSPKASMATARTTNIHQSSTNWAPPSIQPPTCPPSSRDTSITSSKVREIAQEEIRRTQALPSAVVHAYARSASHRSASITPSEVRRIVCEETLALASNTLPPLDPGSKSSSVTPSEVRRIARQEIKSYRGAERAMEAHPNPYSHGRMLPVDEESPHNAQAASIKPAQSDAAVSRPDSKIINAESTIRSISDGQPEYFYISRTAQAVPSPTASAPRPQSYVDTTERQRSYIPSSAAGREPAIAEAEIEHFIVEKDVVEEWSDATRERHYRGQEVFLDGPVRRRGAFSQAASTVNPSSSISQRTQRAPSSSHYIQNSPEEERSTAFYGICEETNRASKDVQIGRLTEDRTPPAGSGITRPTATVPANKDSRPYPRRATAEDLPERPCATSERLYDHQQPQREHETVRVRERYAEEDFLTDKPVLVATQRPGRIGSQRLSNATAFPFGGVQSDYPADSAVVVVDERPVGDDTYVRETHTSPATNITRDSDEITVWPGHVHGQPRANRAPMDSVALHRQRFGVRQDHDKREPGPRLDRDAPYIVPRGSIRRPPSPPDEARIIREDRRYYREGSPSGERIITERIIRARPESPERRGRYVRISGVGASSDQHAQKYNEDIHFAEPSARPRSILRSASTSPGERLGLCASDARVTFASKDNIAPVPQSAPSDTTETPHTKGVSRYHQQSRGHGFDGAASSRTRSEQRSSDGYYYERERGRTSRRYDDQVEGVEDYKPEMNHVLTRALSESPSRERAEDLKKKAESKKRVRIEMMTEAHGPYHAEVSPSPSMEVLTDGSQASHHDPDPQASARTSARGHGMQRRMESIDEGLESVQPGWLRVTKVKQYISSDGRPYEVVEEGIVLDDQSP